MPPDKHKPKPVKPRTEPIFMTYEGIFLVSPPKQFSYPKVPPTSPRENLIFDKTYPSVPQFSRSLKNLEVPYIRHVGIPASMEMLAQFFNCEDFKINLIQFWFLDFVTDCFWRAQDEFHFPIEYQRVVVEWVLYVFDLIRAQDMNLNRKSVFKIFKEAITLAENYVESGCEILPSPEDIFDLILGFDKEWNLDELDEPKSCSSDSTLSFDSDSETESLLAINMDEGMHFFKLPRKIFPTQDDNVETSDSECEPDNMGQVRKMSKTSKISGISAKSDRDKHKNGDSASLLNSEDSTETYSMAPEESIDEEFAWVEIPLVDSSEVCPSEVSTITQDNISRDTKTKLPMETSSLKMKSTSFIHDEVSTHTNPLPEKGYEEEIFQAFYNYNMWHQRQQAMDDPNEGWPFSIESSKKDLIETKDDYPENILVGEELDNEEVEHWKVYMMRNASQIKHSQTLLFVNSCAVMAIQQIVFDYFYEPFQFKLVKLAFSCQHYYITQEVNSEFYVPKKIKDALKKPPIKLPLKLPKDKEALAKAKQAALDAKKEEKERKAREVQETKQKALEAKQLEKQLKEDLKKKEKDVKEDNKEDIAKKKREEAILLEQQRKIEENKKFMFPLSEAVNDEFYKQIFPEFVAPQQESPDKKRKEEKIGALSNTQEDLSNTKINRKKKP